MTKPFLCCFVLIFLGGATTSRAEDWYRWRGPRLDGISTETDWKSDWPDGKAKIAWKQSVGIGFSSVVVKDNRTYTLGHIDGNTVVHCLDATNGNVVWRFAFAAALDDRDFEGGPTSTPTIDGDRIYVLARAGDLFCFNALTGDRIWQIQLAEAADVRLPGWGFSGAPLVFGDKLLVNSGESGAAINKHTGELIWSSDDRECGYASPVVIPGTKPQTAVFASGRAYIGVNVETGEQRWSVRWLTSFNCNAADPIIHDGKMFLCSGYNRGAGLFNLASAEPEPIWKSKEMKNQIHSSILFRGYLYGIDGDMESGARLRCMDWSTGQVKWSVDDLRPGGLTLVGEKLLVLTESGQLVVAPASPDGWSPIAQADVLDGKSWTTPVMSGGRVYCRSIEGQLVCVDCRD